MMFIHLHDVVFYAKHGVHQEEQTIGGEFLLNLSAGFHANDQILTIDNTVDYVTVYELVKQRMNQPSRLLETIVSDISNQILAQFSIVEEVHISIKKLHPPIDNFQGSVGVSFILKRENIQ